MGKKGKLSRRLVKSGAESRTTAGQRQSGRKQGVERLSGPENPGQAKANPQTKIRGFQIDLGKIKAALLEYPGIRDAVVVMRPDAGKEQLAAYLLIDGLRTQSPAGSFLLPNGLTIAQQNRYETEFLYHEIFDRQTYLQHGIELPPDACVFDVGANIGLFTLFAGTHCPLGKIYAFEPIGTTFEHLQRNAALCNASVKLFKIGLAREEGRVPFTFFPGYSVMSGLQVYATPDRARLAVRQYIEKQQEARPGGAGDFQCQIDNLLVKRLRSQTEECQIRTLSAVIREEKINRIDLLKIDVERAELDVLAGIGRADWPKIEQIVLEAHDGIDEDVEKRLLHIVRLLEQHNFTVIVEGKELARASDLRTVYAKKKSSMATRPSTTMKRDIQTSLTSEICAFLRERLPKHMVPATLVVVTSLPLTLNGKLVPPSQPTANASGRIMT